jgi:hypothetical protein
MCDSKRFAGAGREFIYELLMSANASDTKLEPEASVVNSCFSPDTEISGYIAAMQRFSENNANRPVLPSRESKFAQLVIRFLKRCIRKCLRWYIDPVVNTQNAFNSAAVQSMSHANDAIKVLAAATESQKAETERLNVATENLRAETELQKAETENLKAEAESQKAETERLNVAAESLRAETELQKAETENLKAEAELQKTETWNFKAEAEQQKAKSEDVLRALEQNTLLIQQQREEQSRRTELLERRLQSISSLAGGQLMEDFDVYQKTTFSQAGEDSIVVYIFQVLGKLDFLNLTYLDLGSNDPVKMNNTYFLYRHGARGVLVEANPDFIENLRVMRPGDTVLNRLVDTKDGLQKDFYILNGDGLSTPDFEQAQERIRVNPALEIVRTLPVETITVNTIIEKYLMGRAPSLISFDVEGMDFEILKSVDLDRFRPLVIIIEMIPYDARLSVGKKAMDINDFLCGQGYTEYAFTGINSIYIDVRALDSK